MADLKAKIRKLRAPRRGRGNEVTNREIAQYIAQTLEDRCPRPTGVGPDAYALRIVATVSYSQGYACVRVLDEVIWDDEDHNSGGTEAGFELATELAYAEGQIRRYIEALTALVTNNG